MRRFDASQTVLLFCALVISTAFSARMVQASNLRLPLIREREEKKKKKTVGTRRGSMIPDNAKP